MDGFDPTRPTVIPKVVVDRYRKHIREEDANRAEANYAKSAAVGALAGLVARLKKTHAAHRALIGAGAGLLTEGIVRSIGRTTKDPYGERSRAAKRSEKIPVAAGLGVAGGLAYHRIKRAAREFSSGSWPANHANLTNLKAVKNSAIRVHSRDSRVTLFAIPVRLRAKLITAAALAGGITAADAATRSAFPADEETRKQAALKGLREGAIYGSVLAGSEPVLRRIAMKFRRKFPRRKIFEFRAALGGSSRDTLSEQEDIARQRRRLALYAGGALTGAAALALLARSGRSAGSTAATAAGASAIPAGRGTLERLAKANALRRERGYVHLRPMTPGGRKRFDKLPVHIQAGIGKVAKTAVNPNLSGGERQKVRGLLGKIRAAHKFERGQRSEVRGQIEFSSFVKDVAFKDLPARARKDVRAFHPDIPDDTLVAHYGMTTKELAGKADKDNLAAARKNVGKMSRKACADEVYAARGKKFVLVNNDRVIDGHHYLAKAERGRVTASLHVVDLTPSRFQKSEVRGQKSEMEWKLRNAVEFVLRRRVVRETKFFDRGGKVEAIEFVDNAGKKSQFGNPVYFHSVLPIGLERKLRNAIGFALVKPKIIRVAVTHDGYLNHPFLQTMRDNPGNRADIERWHKQKGEKVQFRPKKKETGLERKLRNALAFSETSNIEHRTSNIHEFMYATGDSKPMGNAKPLPDWVQIRRKNKKRHDQLQTAGEVAGIAGGTAAVADVVHKIISRRRAVRLENARAVTHFKRREQLREGGRAEAEKGSGRFVDPLRVTAGLTPGYATLAGGERRYYGGTRGADLPITHAQVLRSAYAHGGSIRKLAHRAGGLLRDTHDVAIGAPRRTDAYGRPQRREWEKPWFHRAVKDVAIGGAVLGGALALKRSPKLRGKVMQAGSEIRRKVNKAIPDFFAGRKLPASFVNFGVRNAECGIKEFAALPIKYGGKIDYNTQDYVYELAKQLRRIVRRRAGLPIRPPIAGSLPAKPSNVIRGFTGRARRKIIRFDEIANYAGWDVRDPRGRSARVFAPGSRRRQRREKQWHERVENQRKLLSALALAGTIAGAGVGVVAGRRFPLKSKPVRKIIPVSFPKVA
jgi:hypothetical protein